MEYTLQLPKNSKYDSLNEETVYQIDEDGFLMD